MRSLIVKNRVVVTLVLLAVLVAGYLGLRALRGAGGASLATETVSRGDLTVTVRADGLVQAYQSAQLFWTISGAVEQINVEVGDVVDPGEVLAVLEQNSLSQNVLLAQVNLIEAQRQLDDLRLSQTQRAEALKAVEEAERALEDGLNNKAAQADALEGVAQAQKELEAAQLNLAIVIKRPPQLAIDQAYANLVLAKEALEQTQEQYEIIQKKLNNPKSLANKLFGQRLRKALKPLELQLASAQRAVVAAQEKYARLLEPVDPLDATIAEGNVMLAQAKLDDAQRNLERVQDGPNPGDIAVLKAQLADARREWERWQDGVDPAEIAAAEARVAAAQAVVAADQITAPFGGVVTGVSITPGDRVSSGSRAFRLDDLDPLLVHLQVSEIDINRVQVGQPVNLTFDAAPGAEYHGRVVETAVVGQDLGGVVGFSVTVELLDPDEKVKPGMTASAEIVVNQLADALLIPNRAIRFLDGRRVVYVPRSGQIVPVEVEIGASSDAFSQVVGGDLQVGDSLMIDLPENFNLDASRSSIISADGGGG